MRHCPKFRKTLRRQRETEQDVAIAGCKSWLCPYCRAVNTRKLRYNVLASIRTLQPTMTWLITLTATGKDRSASGTYSALRRAWPTVRKHILRHYGPFEYLLIYERHQDGAYHQHVIACWLMTPDHPTLHKRLERQLKDHGPSWGIGYIQDVRRVIDGVEGVVRYASKAMTLYLSKGTQSTKDGLPKHAKLYLTSRGIKGHAPPKDMAQAGQWAIAELVNVDEIFIQPVYALALKRHLNTDDFEKSYYWPEPLSPDDEDEL